MVIKHRVEGYEPFLKFMDDLKPEPGAMVIVLYSGSKLPNGKSWCSDCVEAAPFIEKGLEKAPGNAEFVHVDVGDRKFWKDSKCPFRSNPKTRLNVLPTLSLWGTQKRLEGNQCLDSGLYEMFFAPDDD